MENPVQVQRSQAEAITPRRALFNDDAQFRTLIDALPHMVWSTLPDGDHDYYNSRWYEFTGVEPGSTDGEGWNGMFHPDDQERSWARWTHSLRTGEPYEIEYRLRHHSGDYRWTLGRAMPVRGPDGRIVRWIGTCTDIHEARQHAANNEILSRELSHRIKNIFAVISGLISMSAREDPAQKDFAKRLQRRVSALGRAHEFVRPHSEDSAPQHLPATCHGILREILSPYPALTEERIAITGDDIKVDDRSATPMALLVHELATNASKYGALSDPDGRIEIATATDGETFVMRWTESGGPAVAGEPAKGGFGTKLCELSIVQQLGGTIVRDWRREGLSVEAKMPRARLVRPSAE